MLLKALHFLVQSMKNKSNRSELNLCFSIKFHLYNYFILNSNSANSFPDLKFINNTGFKCEYTIHEFNICNMPYMNVIYKWKISQGRNLYSLVLNPRGKHLRDLLDFSWMLNADIKLNYLQKIEVTYIILRVRSLIFFCLFFWVLNFIKCFSIQHPASALIINLIIKCHQNFFPVKKNKII